MVTMDLHAIFLQAPPNLFDAFLVECQKWYEQPAHTFTEMRVRDNKKVRGDVFEEFCVLYLKHVRKFENVWRLENVPDELLIKLSLKRPDVGIDIIAESGGKYYAVQCKYKKHVSTKKNIVTWKALSTFYALCMRTGPWEKYIVMTNCEYCRHMGKKTVKDVSICLKTLQSITKEQWIEMCEKKGDVVDSTVKKLTADELRSARLARFSAAGSGAGDA
jgi:predicted helicase